MLRRITQVGFLILWTLLPWLNVVRIDINTSEIIYLGHTYPMVFPEILGLIIPFVAMVWGIALLTYFKGRVFCGWACPYGSSIELFDGLRTAIWTGTNRKVAAWMKRSLLHTWVLRVAAGLTLVAAPVLLALSLAAYLVAPQQILRSVFLTSWGHGGMVQTALLSWLGLTFLLCMLAGFIVRFHFCRMVCIYGMGQAMAASAAEPAKVLRPRYLPETTAACGSCQACVKACFVELDPREPVLQLGFSSGCFNCGDCIDVCETVQGHRQQASLLTFRLPAPLPRPRGRRASQSLDFEDDGLS